MKKLISLVNVHPKKTDYTPFFGLSFMIFDVHADHEPTTFNNFISTEGENDHVEQVFRFISQVQHLGSSI